MFFVTESSWMNCGGGEQDPVAFGGSSRQAPRAKAVLSLRGKGWLGQPLPGRVGRGVSMQHAFATLSGQVAEVEVSKDGAVRVRRVVCAVDLRHRRQSHTVQAQIQSAIIFGVTAALYGRSLSKTAVSSKTNSTPTQMLRMNEARPSRSTSSKYGASGRNGRGRDFPPLCQQ